MAISPEDLPGIQSNLPSLKSANSVLSSVNSSVSSRIKDPIGSALTSTLSSINSLSATVADKVDKLEQDLTKSVDNTGKVKLSGNTIVVTLEPEDAAKLPQYQAKIQGSIDSINNTINKLKVVTSTLSVISNTAKTLKVAMDVQEAALTVGNPVAAATMALLKKAIKILFYRDVLEEYNTIIASQMSSSQKSLNKLSERFASLSVQFVVDSNRNKGETTTTQQAETKIQQGSLIKDQGNEPQYYTNDNNKSYILNVETYSTRELIGKARDKYSGLLVAETSPSFISTPDQLIEELKAILNK